MKNIHVTNLEDKIVDIGQDIIIEDLESLEKWKLRVSSLVFGRELKICELEGR